MNGARRIVVRIAKPQRTAHRAAIARPRNTDTSVAVKNGSRVGADQQPRVEPGCTSISRERDIGRL
jgi:hypothetical protein